MRESGKKPTELLAPAGGPEHFIAAVENGADAVYFGGKGLNARGGAGNFSKSEMEEAVRYASLRDVKTYLTLNVLVKDEEIGDALRQAEEALELGVRGLIVQDLGLASLLRRIFPGVRLHLSTQGTVYNREGAIFAQNQGFRRVILAREMSEGQIRDVVEHTEIETEIFVHGALCVCYSGQCKMSRMIGTRSGNRGSCAQPCRFFYELEMDGKAMGRGYLLSPGDICLLRDLKRVADLGVDSVKLEGRMKSPEYTAAVTAAYRRALDWIEKEGTEQEEQGETERLAQIYHRKFIKGYFAGERNSDILSGESPKHQGLLLGTVTGVKPSEKVKGKYLLEVELKREVRIGDGIEVRPMSGAEREKLSRRKEKGKPAGNPWPGGTISYIKWKKGIGKDAAKGQQVWLGDVTGKPNVGDPVFKMTDSLLMTEIQATYQGKSRRKSRIYGSFVATDGEPITFHVWDEFGNEGMSVLEKPWEDDASEGGMPREERILAQLKKTGDTPFFLESCELRMEEGIRLSIGEINQLRREALEDLSRSKLENQV